MENWRFGMLASTQANLVPRKRGHRALTPQDFYPKPRKGRSMTTSQHARGLRENYKARKAKREKQQKTKG